MTLPNELICIDLETTGVDPVLASIVQLSAIIVDTEFEPIPGLEFDSYVKPLDNFRDPKAMNLHQISENLLLSSPSLEEVLIMFENFCGKYKLLASWGNHFDIPFLFGQYKKLYREIPFQDKSIDLKSIAIWEFAKNNTVAQGGLKKYLEMADKEFKGIQHDSLSDIRNTVELLRTFKGRRN